MDRYDSTSWSIVLGAAAGQPSERERFSRTYGPVIKSYLAARWRVPFDDPEVDDGMQEVFMQIWKPDGALRSVDPSRAGGFRAFLFGIVRNVALMIERSDRRRRRRVATESALGGEPVVSKGPTSSEVFDRAFVEAIAREARGRVVQRLAAKGASIDHARVLEMRYADGLPPREIAARLEVPVEAIYEGLRRAKAEYREAVLDVLAFHQPGASRAELEERFSELGGVL